MITVRLLPVRDPSRVEWHVATDHDREHVIAYETVHGEPPAPPDRADVGAILALARAMNFRQDLHVAGPVSWSLLANLEELVDVWTRWRPDLYGRIAITAEEVLDDRHDGPGPFATRAAAAFSGGVDGTYAVASHVAGLLGRRQLDVAAAVLVHGFDVPLAATDGWAAALAGARAMTEDLGVPLVAIRTNWKDVCLDWEMEFGMALAAVLQHFTDRAGVALVADDNPYEGVHLPWGTNPISQRFLGSNRMRTVGSGGGVGRTDKCRAIGRWPAVREHVRVCWEGPDPGRNCQRCEKCIRTNLAFVAAGVGEVPALGRSDVGRLRQLEVRSSAAVPLWDDIVANLDAFPADQATELLAFARRAHDRFPHLVRPARLDEPS